ncbi:MAG: hypothetical protein B7Y36_12980 [Novosphingobium sp. 28-62-57]|uniref:DUF4118 domain-containing protein n=1 Tax=unclassified Novosphingobium TaxID=2644732 RepID=UPI000BD8D58A|nr:MULTISPECIES: DUF4118 domain-containing protein [unclassified Novosphingobium]OYW48323.1 MAG: hypothetical protein B7Z34_14355 [Novosphingobium sp. 12-62-10]OYZ09446.1 MAG: hypothetical protein B7Y36_12980 [Novosphingobium sp. 28-62-57]OZA33866.1 MAG: hypothetical protein B7X92_10950 [Novosphingobium sp. 17-62-9]HQS70401.1 DUF4118 domain-containing protein [Novosphingobium sp.]
MFKDAPSPANRTQSATAALSHTAAALLLGGISTAIGVLIAARWGNAPVVMLYLPPVLYAATFAGLASGLFAALASALAFNYFFTSPYHTFQIHSPADIVTVVVLFVVAAVCSQLAASVRRQSRLAADHAARNAAVAGFARRLLSTRDLTDVAQISAGQLAALFGCQVAVVGEGAPVRVLASIPADATPNPDDLAAAAFAMEFGESSGRGQKRAPQADWQFHPVTSESAVLAAIGLAREDGAPPVPEERQVLFESLLNQMALALERARLEGEAREAAGIRAREKLRSALLGSIGDDIKPRIRAVQASIRALRREGTMDKAALSSLDGEVTRIERHIDNLVDLQGADEGEPVSIGDVVIDLHLRTVLRNGEPVHLTPKEFAVLAELTKSGGRTLAHSQLLRAVWGPAQQDHIDYLRVAIMGLRRKIEEDAANPQLVVNVPGVGYRLAIA